MDAKEFEWESQLRFYWEKEPDELVVRQCTGEFGYGYEYMGLNGRLVITPLTDRIYLTLTQVMYTKRKQFTHQILFDWVKYLLMSMTEHQCLSILVMLVDRLCPWTWVVPPPDLQVQVKQRPPRIWPRLWGCSVWSPTVERVWTLRWEFLVTSVNTCLPKVM